MGNLALGQGFRASVELVWFGVGARARLGTRGNQHGCTLALILAFNQ